MTELKQTLSSIDKERLHEICRLLLLFTRGTVAVYAQDGTCVLRLVDSPYCKMHNEIYDNQCESACWTSCAQKSADDGSTISCTCIGGLNLYATPIRCENQTIGVLSTSWGDKPKDLAKMAETGELTLESLEEKTKDHFSMPTYLLETLKLQLEESAKSIGFEVLRQRKSDEMATLLDCTKAILGFDVFEKTARHIFDSCTKLTGATAGYVALLSDDGAENEVLFLEAGGRPCTVDPELPMPIRGLRAIAYETGKAAYDNDFWNSKWMEFMPEGHVTMDNVLFSPLNIEGKTVGIMGIANKPGGFTEEDARLATAFGEMAAIALNNSRTKNALVESTKKYSALFDNMLSGFAYHRLITDEEGEPIDYEFVDVNESFLDITDMKREELVGRRVTDVFPGIENDEADWIGRYGHVALTGEPTTFEQFSQPMQRHFTVKAYSFEKGFFAVVFDDVSRMKKAAEEKRKIEARILEAQKLESLGVLAGGIAHDFNNLLVAILGNADLAIHDVSKDTPTYECLNDIIKASTQAADLCKQMLAYSGKGRFIVQDVNLNEVISDMSAILLVSLSKKASLQLNLAPKLPAVEADVTQVRQLLMNLLTNASEALGGDTGNVSVSTGSFFCDETYLAETFAESGLEEGEYVFVEVSDSGCGMNEETRKKIFEPFFSTKFTGRGLGLAAIQGIVRGHKGAIKVYSELGKGTTFKVLLPSAERLAQPAPEIESKYKGWRGSGTILLVDDEPSVIQAATRMVKKLGFDIITATNGQEAVELFEEHQDQIVCTLLDLTMPVMDGKEAFRALRQIDKKVMVILSSGYNEQEATQIFSGKGLAGFIQKPYRLKALRREIRRVLDEED